MHLVERIDLRRYVEGRKWTFAVLTFFSVSVLLTLFPSLGTGFWTDDYIFMEMAGRYANIFFDPRLAINVYRPVQGLLWVIQWGLFHGNAVGYHVVYVLMHLSNCLLLYALIMRVSHRWLVGVISVSIYSGLAASGLALFWLGDPTVPATLFYLLTIWFWLKYFDKNAKVYFWLTLISFVLAVFTKEMNVTLPVALFLVERGLLGHRARLNEIFWRYLPFAVVLLPYLGLEFFMVPHTGFKNNLGYGLGLHLMTNLVQYLTVWAFPWGSESPISYIWLLIMSLIYTTISILKRTGSLFFLVTITILVLLPVIPFQYVQARYLYFPLMSSPIGLGLLLEWGRRRFKAHYRVYVPLAAGATALVVLLNGWYMAEAANNWAGFSREGRLPLRTISQRHPSFPDDTLLYFIDPPVPISSGMFFLRDGPRVSVGGDATNSFSAWRDEPPEAAGLRRHNEAYVYYFDERGRVREQKVGKEDITKSVPSLPIGFGVPLQLEGCEIASMHVTRDEAIIVLLYWRAEKKIEKDYSVFAHLVNARGEVVASSDSQPRAGKSPTSTWKPGDLVVDWAAIPITQDIPAGNDYHLEIGMYYLPTMERLPVVDAQGETVGDKIVIEPLEIVE